MQKRILFGLIFSMISGLIIAQKLTNTDTIHIALVDYEKKIVFNHEMLYDFSGYLDDIVLTYIDANKFLDYVNEKANVKFYRSQFTDDEANKIIADLTKYLNENLSKSNELIIDRPDYQTALETRSAIKDMNFAIFHLLRNGYFEQNMKQGLANFYYQKNKTFADMILVNTYIDNKKGRKIIKYILNRDGHEIFSENKELK